MGDFFVEFDGFSLSHCRLSGWHVWHHRKGGVGKSIFYVKQRAFRAISKILFINFLKIFFFRWSFKDHSNFHVPGIMIPKTLFMNLLPWKIFYARLGTYFHNPVVLYLNIVRTYYDHKHWTFDIVIPFPSVYK